MFVSQKDILLLIKGKERFHKTCANFQFNSLERSFEIGKIFCWSQKAGKKEEYNIIVTVLLHTALLVYFKT